MYKIYNHKLCVSSGYTAKILLIMRLTTLFLLTAVLQVAANSFAQKVSLKVREAPLVQVFQQIRSQTGYDFVFTSKTLEDANMVSIDRKNAELKEVLDEIFRNQPLEFSIDAKTVVVSRKVTSLLDRLIEQFNNSDVRGRVVDSVGNPLPGATVKIRGGKRMVVTGADGAFSFSNVADHAILVISYLGYKDVEIEAKPLLGNITMRLLSADLEEVTVVSTGYQTLPKERSTGSFGVVTAKELSQYPVTSVLERLQGLVPGVNISTKTVAGKSRNGTINIRGISTLVSSYTKVNVDPLLVIDGFPSQQSITNGAFDFINPDDIEQITFLKDAAAASIWGIQAANGVIVVTTKKGARNSRPVFGFTSTFGTSKRPRANYGKMMSMQNYIELEKELIDKKVLSSDPSLVTSGFFPENNSQAQAIIWAEKRGAITPVQRDAQLAALAMNDNADQVSELLLQPPTTRQYNLSVSGGGIANSYFISGYFYNEDRAYKSNTNKGYSLKASNVSNLLDDRIRISTDLSIGNTRDKINGSAVRAMGINAGGLRPYDMLKDAAGNTVYYDVITTPQVARNLESKGYLPFRYSPLDELDYSNSYNTGTNLNMNMAVNGKLTDWLNLNVSGNFGRTFSERETYWEPDSYEARTMVNRATSLNTAGAKVLGLPSGGRLDLNNALSRTYSVRGQLNVDKNWNDKHQLNILLGNEIREQFSKESGEFRYGYDKAINAFRVISPGNTYRDMNGSTQSISATSRPVVERTTRALSYYANGSYTYDQKYTLSGSARFDDYNLLGVDRRKRAIPLWSAGLKWNLKNEAPLKEIAWLNQLSARATYGFSGNAPQGYAPVAVINMLGNEFYTGYPYGLIATPAIDDLGWETTRMINYGLDFSLFGRRVSGSVEYYKKHTKDIIWSMPINGAYGFTSTLFNTANLNGDGVDIGLTVVPLSNAGFRLSSTLNVSYNTNVVKDTRFDVPTGSFSPENLYDGYPNDYVFSYLWAGLDATGQSLIRDPNNQEKTYTIMEYPFQDIRTYSGRSSSPWFGSFSNDFQYKQWTLNVQLQYVLGGVFRKPSIVSIGFSNNVNVGRSGDLDERWRNPGDEAHTNVPGLIFGANANYFQSLGRYTESDYLIRSRSNVRLQQVMLSYSLPQKVLSKIGIKGLNFSAVGRNLGMIWAANKEKLDPDYIYTTGLNYQLAPVASYSFRTSLNF